ncbi:MAG: hypothetical protein KBT34_07105 [Prevotella sp.]|nr:hypothetical protein [Candidatus Prevotella equi]
MKKIFSFIMLIVALMTTTTANAGGGTFYAKVVAQATPTGAGKVYVSTSQTSNPAYAETSEATGNKRIGSGDETHVAFNAYAQSEFGYKFVGWYDNAELTGEALSTEAKYQYDALTKSKEQNSPTISNLYAQFEVIPNTLLLDKDYKVSGVVSLAEGLSESSVPEAFKKYLENDGNYVAYCTIDGDKNELTINNNTEGGILNGFTIKGDQMQFSPANTFKLDGKTFSVVKADETTVNTGVLDITAIDGEEACTINDLAVVYHEKVIGYVKNIKIEFDENHTAADMITADNNKKSAVKKYFKNGKLFIKKNGKVYNAAGAVTE